MTVLKPFNNTITSAMLYPLGSPFLNMSAGAASEGRHAGSRLGLKTTGFFKVTTAMSKFSSNLLYLSGVMSTFS